MCNKTFDTNTLLELSKNIIEDNYFINLDTFNDEMLISQVVKFFSKHNRKFTKTMIQNYVRVGLLPPPVEKRYYTKDHLVLLIIIDNLKEIYSLDELKSILSPILKDPETFEDDIINVTDLYSEHVNLYSTSLEGWKEVLPNTLDNIKETIKAKGIKDEESETAAAFLLVLVLMTQTIAMKKLSKLIAEKYLK